MKKIIIFFCSYILTLNFVHAQIDSDYMLDKKQDYIVGKQYVFEFRDGTIAIGKYLKSAEGNIYIKDLKGEDIYIPKIMIAQVHESNKSNVKGDEFWFSNLHDTRYFFSPTAFGLRQGEGYYHHGYWILWQFQYGLSDYFSIGGGTTPFGFPAMLNGKFSMEIDSSSNFSLGWFWVGNLFWGDFEGDPIVNMPYGVLTFGNKETNFTLGTGYNLSTEISSENRFVFNIGAIGRVERRFSLLLEAWLFNVLTDEPTFLGGPGVRYFRKVNRVTSRNGAGASTWDIQFLYNPQFERIIPVFGASRKF